MTGPVFVDTNVFLYARDEREPAKLPRARAWLDHLWREGLGRTSVQVLSEYYVNLRRKGFSSPGPDEAWEAVAKYLSWRPQAVNDEVFTRAREFEKRYRLSWWDAMVVAAAQLQECRVLLTEDLQDGMTFGTVRVRNPFLHAVEQAPAEYSAAVPARILHRPRGRPRRTAAA